MDNTDIENLQKESENYPIIPGSWQPGRMLWPAFSSECRISSTN
jgi:hypothetical protein